MSSSTASLRTPLPDHLQHHHLAALQTQQPLYFTSSNINITVIPPSQPATFTPAEYEEQQYLRILDQEDARQASKTMPEVGQIISFNAEDIYKVHGKIVLGLETYQERFEYLIAKTGETTYYLLRYLDSKPVAKDEKAAGAFIRGPFPDLPNILLHDLSRRKKVSVLFSSKPSPYDYANLNLSEKASRIRPACLVDIAIPDLRNALSPVEHEAHGMCESTTMLNLFFKEIYSPRTNETYDWVPLVRIVAQPKSLLFARDTLYKMQHMLCRRGFFDVEIQIVVGIIQLR